MSSSALAAGLRHLRGKLAAQQKRDDSDEQLLHAFTTHRDDNAFAVIVRRHGPMVLHVCRRVLGHEQDAEDAFQATFLVLARNAASLRNKASLASFLHGTAYRTALKAKQAAACRRKYERALGALTRPRSPVDPADELSWGEAKCLLDEEIARLPEIYRVVFVHFYLQDHSHAETARRLGLTEATVAKRLTEARKRLGQRLRRRGVELTAVLAAISLSTQTASALPAGLMTTTVKAALGAAAGEGLAGIVSASVAELVQGATMAMMGSKAKIAAVVLLLLATSGALVGWLGRAREPLAATMEAPAAKVDGKPPAASSKRETPKSVAIQGRVLDPHGKPVRGARLYLPEVKSEQIRPLATSDAAGRFRFQVMPAAVRLSPLSQEPWRSIYVVAVAEGYGPAFTTVGDPAQADKLILRLVKDGVPIKGRVLDLQGKPVAGATARVDSIGVPNKGDLAAFLDDLKDRSDGFGAESKFLTTVNLAHFGPTLTTGADGRFQIKGIGRERLAHLTISGPTIETRQVSARTRPGETLHAWAWGSYPHDLRQNLNHRFTYYGAEFEHAAAATRPILGVVRDKDSGKPLANVIIRSGKPSPRGHDSVRTVTDKDGRYRLVGLPKGDNVIEVEPPEGAAYLRRNHIVKDTFGIDPVTVDFELRRGVLVKGRVIDKKTGAGVEARIGYFVFHDNPARDELRRYRFRNSSYQDTEADGSFRMIVPPGHGLLAANIFDGHYRVGLGAEKIKRMKLGERMIFLPTDPLCDPTGYHRFLEIDPGKDVQTLTCSLEVDPGRTLTGTIVGPDGKPLPGARIRGLRSYSWWEADPLRTAEFTVYALCPSQPRTLLALHEGKRLAGSLVVLGEEKGPVTFKLQPWGLIMGRLVTPDGKPYTKGELGFDDVFAHPQNGFPLDKNGRFRIEGLVPGWKHHLRLRPVGRLEKDEVTVAAGETKDLGDVTVKENE